MRFDIPEEHKKGPTIQMAPLMDIIFITLIFFVTLSIFYQMESEINISVPKAKEAKESARSPGEIVINITKEGSVTVNKKSLSYQMLEDMLKQISSMYPNQPIIIRADRDTKHEYVIRVLDACSAANIWNVAFATEKIKKTDAAG